MNKKVILQLSIAVFLLLGAFVFGEHSFAVKNANDEIYLAKPIQSEVISGSYNMQWFMYDPDMASTPYDIDLFSLKCEENGTYFGKIGSGIPPAPADHIYTKEWNTKGPIINVASIADGNYCLRVCGFFVNQPGNHYYGLCDKHSITINNSGNLPPVITSQPKDVDLKTGETFSYQVVATDPNGDSLTYGFATASEFFAISQTGLMESKGKLQKVGVYKLTVQVSDGKTGVAEQPLTINVTDSDVELAVSFSRPKANDVFSKSGNEVSWIVNSQSAITTTLLSISSDAKKWQEVTTLDSKTSYSMDVTEFANGEYYLQVKLTDSTGNTVEAVSEKFIIDNDKETGGEVIPFISELRPEDGSKTTERRPEISALISPADSAQEIDMEQIELELDGSADLLDCKFEERLFCTVTEDLEFGLHKLFLSVSPEGGKTEIKEWSFEVVESEDEQGGNNNGGGKTDDGFSFSKLISNLSGETIRSAFSILCIGLTLLLIPWLLYFVWKRMRARRGESTSSSADPFAPAPFATTSYTEPKVASSADVFDTTFEPTIGSQTMGEQPATPQFSATDLGGIDPNQTAEEMIAQPTAYTSEEVPDWLKDFEASTPGAVNQSGDSLAFNNTAASDEAAGAKVHDPGGVDLNLDETSDK